jgi:hypothetical protein
MRTPDMHLAGSLLATFAVLAGCGLAPAASGADATSPAAREWLSYCQPYIRAVDGDPTVSDLDLTYCVGVTKGLLNGMQVGAQLGALSFGSRLALQYKLDPDEVFKIFQEQDPGRLLGICAPSAATTQDYVRAVLQRLEKNPGDAQRPIAEVFYEALVAAFPCP